MPGGFRLFFKPCLYSAKLVGGKECPASFLNLENRNGTHRLIPLKNRLRDSLTSFRFLQMILMDRIGMPDVPLDVYLFLNFRLLCIVFFISKFWAGKAFISALSGRPGTFLLPGADYSPGIRFKTTAAILAVVQRLLSYNTCRGFQLLRSDNFSWLLHLPGNIELVDSKSRGMLLMTGKIHLIKSWTDYSTVLAAEEKLSPAWH